MTYYLNEYLTNREYGGPEEGGWYYGTGEFVQCHGTHPTQEDAETARLKLQTYLGQERRGKSPAGSVACTGWPEICIETHPGHDYPETTPQYQ